MDLVEAKKRTLPDNRHPWELARIEVVKKLIAKKVKLENGSVVLDIGCGDTFAVESIAENYPGVSFYAIDTAFTDEIISRFKSRIKNPNIFLFRSLDEIRELPASPSLVLLMDVVEHIENDVDFLTKLVQKNYISRSTHILITVPAYQSLFCSHDEFLGHYRRYTNRMLKEHVWQAGLEVTAIGYFFFSLLPIRVAQKIKETIFTPAKKTTGLAEWNGGKLVSAMFKNMLLADFACSFALKKMSINLPGLSNYAICKRPA